MNPLQHRYSNLLIDAVTGYLYANDAQRITRQDGHDWPTVGHTMIGLQRARQLRSAAWTILTENIPGDFAECGVWRGGACILLAGMLAMTDASDRLVYVCDSFSGVPEPTWEQDIGYELYRMRELAVSMDEVSANIEEYELSDYVSFVPGLFRDSLPGPITQLSLLRVDADLYESTWQVLEALYPLLSPGGYCIIDDYFSIPTTWNATDAYRLKYMIQTPIVQIDWCGGYWRKP